jgi:hypothetical protein
LVERMSDLKPGSQTTGGDAPARVETAKVRETAPWPIASLCGMVNGSSRA